MNKQELCFHRALGTDRLQPDTIYDVVVSRFHMTKSYTLWTFTVLGPIYKGFEIEAKSTSKVNPRSKLFKWLTCLGYEFEPGKSIEVDPEGKECRLKIGTSHRFYMGKILLSECIQLGPKREDK